jgi:hypothetical protein
MDAETAAVRRRVRLSGTRRGFKPSRFRGAPGTA